MSHNISKRFFAVLATLALLAFAGTSRAQGLKFASDEALRGVPLASTPFSGAELPKAVDMSNLMPPPGNQGKQNSCVGWTVAYGLKSYQERVEAHAAYHFDADHRVSAQDVFSPTFIYNQINNGRDGGCQFLDALNLLSSQGVATWADMPYNESDFTTTPSAEVKARAKIYRIDTWRRVNVSDTNEVKAHLAAGFPVMIGAKVDEGFEAARAGFIWREATGQQKGAHAMLVVGYDDAKGAFKLLNSWGTRWGDGGYGWIDYGFFRTAVHEAYVAKDAHNSRPEPVRPVEIVRPDEPVRPDQPVVVNPAPANDPVQPDIAQLLQMVQFRWGTMQHNVVMNDHPEAGNCMALMGRVDVPPGLGEKIQVVLFYFYDNGTGGVGMPVRSLQQQYATVDGMAADGTRQIPVGPGGIGNMGLTSVVPYSTLNIPAGQRMISPDGQVFYQPRMTALVAVPVLFVDGFGVKTGPAQHFFVMR